MNVIKFKKSLIGFLKTRLRKEPLFRAAIASVFSVGTACSVVSLSRHNYWAGTIHRTQTVDFNILSNLLPTKVSTYLSKSPLTIDDIDGLQKTLDSNYGLFGIVVTDCKRIEDQCPNQNIIYASKSKVEHISSGRQRLVPQNRSAQKWTKKFENKDLSDELLISSPFVILRDPPPLYQEWGFETPSSDKKIFYDKQNKGKIIGRAYFVRADVPRIDDELKNLRLVYISVGISALITGLLILLSIEFSYYLIKEAENKEAIAVKAQIQAENALRLARKASDIAIEEKEQSEEAARLAQEASNRASHEKEQAEAFVRFAQEASNRANHEREQAEVSVRNIQTQSSHERQELEEAVRVAQEASNRANHEKEQAEKAALLAQENSDRANYEKEQAENSALLAQENSDRANYEKEQAENSALLAQEERDSARTDNNTLLNELDTEIERQTNSLWRRIEELERINIIKEAEKQSLVNQHRTLQEEKTVNNIVIISEEKDFYASERKDIIIETIQKHINNELKDSRRYHILSNIINKNQPIGENDRIKKSILTTLTGYRKSDRIKSPLIRIGFDEIPGQNYLKLSWKGDIRYTFSLSKTPSGNNTGENKAHEIFRKIL